MAATQLVVYAGGVVILMLFAVMLTGGVQGAANRFGIEKVPSMGNKKDLDLCLGLPPPSCSRSLVKLFVGPGRRSPSTGELPPYESTVEKIG